MKSLFLSTIFTLLCFCGFATTVTVNASSTGTTTSTTKTSGTITVNSSTNRGYAVFNLASASIPAAATITSVKVIFTHTTSGSGNPTRTMYGYVGDISSLAAGSLYSGAVTANTLYTASWGNTATTKTMASTAGADTFIQHNHTNTISVTWVETGGTTRAYSITGGTSPQIQITYTCTTPSGVSITASSTSICSGSSETFTGNATGGNTYAWSGPNGFVSTLRNPAAFTTSTASAGTYTFTATSTCNISTSATRVITVKTVPSAMSGSTVVCLGGTTVLSNTGIGGTWSRSNTRASVTSGGVVTGVTAGTVNITYNTGCGSAAVQNMSVRTTPAAITGSSNVCTGATVALADATAGGTWSSSNTGVATVNASGVVTGVAVGTTTITYNNQGCGIATKVVNDLTSAGSISGATTLCTGLTTTLTNPTAGGTWSSSNTGRATVDPTSGVVTGLSSGAVTITYNAGCGTNATLGMTMNASPNAISGATSVCSSSSTTLTCSPAGGTWSTSASGTASVNATGTVTGVAQGAATISYTRSGCPSILAFSVKTTPAAITGSSNVCSGTTTTLANASIAGTWTTSNSAIASVASATGIVTGVANGTATITYSTGCGSAATRSETVISTPAAITGTTTVCGGSTTTLADGTSGGSWSSSDNTLATVTSGGVVRGVAQGTVTITYAISSCVATTSVLVKVAPAAITGTSAFCGAGSATLANTSNLGFWTSSDTTVALVDSNSGLLVVFAPGSAVISYANGCGSAATRTASYDYVPDPISGTTTTCTGNTTTLSDAISGGTWSSSNNAIASVNTSGVVYGTGAGSATISYTLTNGCGTNTVTAGATISQTGLWSGASSADWNDAGNWPCGTIPDASTDVTIPSGTAHLPSFAGATFDVNSLTVNAGVTISIGGDASVAVHGSMTNNGIINGDGDIAMVGGSAQTMYGKGTFSNLTINNSNGVTIASTDTVRIIEDLTLTAGTLTTNSGLRLLSTSTGTGRIAPITGGAISGNVNIDQYLEGGRRAFRFFGHPFSSAIALNMIGANLDITGNGGSSNGFTQTASNAASCFRYDPTVGNSAVGYDPGWRPFTSALTTSDTNGFKQYQGIRLFVRGAKGEGLGYVPYTPSATTIKMIGAVNTGTQVVTLYKGTNSDYNQISNPYPSPTNIGSVIATAHAAGRIAGSAFYVWNPFLGSAGAYEAKIIGGSYILDQNSSFQVRAASNAVTLTFNESDKATNGDETLLRTAPSQYITLGVYDANNHGWDKMFVSFNDNATNNEDVKYDAIKATNPDLNFYTYAGNTKFAVDARPYSNNTVIPVGFTTNYAQQYTIKAENIALPAGATIYLHDKMLNQYVLLQAGTEYSFDVTSDKATQGENRFEFTTSNNAAMANNAGLNVTVSPNPATDNVTIAYTTDANAATTVNVMNAAGASVISKVMGSDANGKVTLSLTELPAGIYMVEVASGNSKKIQKLVKE